MSPRWHDEVEIRLAPRQLTLRRHARALGGRGREALELPVAAAGIAEVGPALGRLVEALREPAWQRSRARVVVSDAWVRYAVVPPPPARLDAEGRLTHARYVLRDLFGDALDGWAVTLSDTPPGRPCVACAMPAELRAGVEDALAAARLGLVSLRPRLVAGFEAWRRQLPGQGAWFVCVDEGWLSAVELRGREWQRVHGARLSSDWALELERLQAFARFTHAAGPGGRVFVDAPARMRAGMPGGEDLVWLGGEGGGEDGGTQARAVALRGG